MANVGVFELLALLIGIGLLVLVGLAARKLMRGELRGGPQPSALTPGEAAEDEALAREAMGEEPAETPANPPAATPAPAAPEVSAPTPMERGLERTRKGFMARINGLLFGGRSIDPGLVDELEEILVTSDIGIRTAQRLLGDLRASLGRKELADPEVVRARLKAKVAEIVSLPIQPLQLEKRPFVLMVIGVNGVGKTTTIGKLAARYGRQGKKVVLAAGDTFRAAAVEQLEIWAQRADAKLVKGLENADPASVGFEAIQAAIRDQADLCIADTAGRLHTKVNLMEELKKVRRVMSKAIPDAPHEVVLVLDATTGQNAIAQAKEFTNAVQVGSIALTKLDGTAKGGVVVAICDELKLPVRFVGVGEGIDDLRDFDPGEFVEALFERDAPVRDAEGGRAPAA